MVCIEGFSKECNRLSLSGAAQNDCVLLNKVKDGEKKAPKGEEVECFPKNNARKTPLPALQNINQSNCICSQLIAVNRRLEALCPPERKCIASTVDRNNDIE